MKRSSIPLLFTVLAACGGSRPLPVPGATASASPPSPGRSPEVISTPAAPSIVPLPAETTLGSGAFTFGRATKIAIDERAGDAETRVAEYLAELVGAAVGIPLQAQRAEGASGEGSVLLRLDPSLSEREGYRLVVRPDHIDILAKQAEGLYYGVQTLRQLLPPEAEGKVKAGGAPLSVPAIDITDAPRFRYRGMHLDTSRHFFPIAVVKKYIDMLSLFKFNVFHWHLTDDQGWRIEIKKYPKLTEVGAWRKETLVGHEGAKTFDGQRHGGYYTQEEIKDVVSYAKERFVTIVPEIEMPGHARAALAAYPELACTKGPFEVATGWGVFHDIFCPTERTFAFLEDVLSEVLSLFPGPYVHIGGDEVPKIRWKKSAEAQKVIQKEHLKNEEELQSYFVRRMGTFLAAKGRRMIGWEEILQGGLAKDATVMSWQGFDAGIAAAKQNHDVIMTPQDYVYFDSYQAEDTPREPLAIGGFLAVEKVYGFDPVPASFTTDQAAHVLGGQGNAWTEYIATEKHLEYMVFPRLLALSEALWSPAARKDWDGFSERLPPQLARLRALGVNYASHFFYPRQKSEVNAEGQCIVTLRSNARQPIYYTIDGSEPGERSPLYERPIALDRTATVKAVARMEGEAMSPPVAATYVVSLATGKPVAYANPFSEKYPAGRERALTDAVRGGANAGDGRWLGFSGSDLDATLDLGQTISLKSVGAGFLRDVGEWVMLPRSVEFSISDDGKNFRPLANAKNDADDRDAAPLVKTFAVKAEGQSARYVRVHARNYGKLPAWHPGTGTPAWLFVDEIIVE
jgi:hexosaminidase